METSGRAPAELALEARAARTRPESGTRRTASRRLPGRVRRAPRSPCSSRCGARRAPRSAPGPRTEGRTRARAGGERSTRAARPARRGRNDALDGDQDREGDHRLRHRRPSELLAFVATPRDHALMVDDAGGGVLGAPLLDLLQNRFHDGPSLPGRDERVRCKDAGSGRIDEIRARLRTQQRAAQRGLATQRIS